MLAPVCAGDPDCHRVMAYGLDVVEALPSASSSKAFTDSSAAPVDNALHGADANAW